MNASAKTGGHFNASANPTTLTGHEDATHNLEFRADSGGETDCTNASYHGITPGGTQTSFTFTPNWSNCFTTGSETKFEIHENGCTLRFTVAPNPSTEHNTVDICDFGGPLHITHPNCTMIVPKQTVNGVLYTPTTVDGKKAITLDSTIKFNVWYEGGICVFLGTNHTAELLGSMTITGEKDGNPVDIAATGP